MDDVAFFLVNGTMLGRDFTSFLVLHVEIAASHFAVEQRRVAGRVVLVLDWRRV